MHIKTTFQFTPLTKTTVYDVTHCNYVNSVRTYAFHGFAQHFTIFLHIKWRIRLQSALTLNQNTALRYTSAARSTMHWHVHALQWCMEPKFHYADFPNQDIPATHVTRTSQQRSQRFLTRKSQTPYISQQPCSAFTTDRNKGKILSKMTYNFYWPDRISIFFENFL